MNSFGLNYLSLKYKKFTPFGYKDIEIRKFHFVAKTQFRCLSEYKVLTEFTLKLNIKERKFKKKIMPQYTAQ